MMTRRLEHESVVYEDGQLAIKYEYSVFSEPKIVTMFWSFGPCRLSDVEHLIGKDVRNIRDGAYEIRYSGTGLASLYQTLRLPEGGSTKAFKVFETDYPCPPVRKGIETRYYNGVWQKYLKRDGWLQLT